MAELHVIEHPLIYHRLAVIRDKNTGFRDFREAVSEISLMLCYEAARDLPLRRLHVETPVSPAEVSMIDCDVTLVPILRAGLGMLEGALRLIPSARVGHIGLFRDEQTLEPVDYYRKMPENVSKSRVLLLDPMLATGGSASAAISSIKRCGCESIRLLCVIAAPEGAERLRSEHPDVDIYAAALDKRLNERGYIVPGLGDAGDRIFGTVQ